MTHVTSRSGRAPNCKITTEFAGDDYFEDAAMNRSRTDSARGSVVSWYQIASPQFPHDGMQMGLVEMIEDLVQRTGEHHKPLGQISDEYRVDIEDLGLLPMHRPLSSAHALAFSCQLSCNLILPILSMDC